MYSTIMRDTSLDQNTYWIRDGNYYGRARSLGAPPCVLPPDKLAQIPEMDRALLLEEVAGNPSFCAEVAKCMATHPDWAARISRSANEAVANEMDPFRFRNRKGLWPKLRARVQDLVESSVRTIRNKVSSMTLNEKVAELRRMSSRQKGGGLSGLGDLGFFDFLASVIGAAGNVYTQDLVADTQKDIAKIQANTSMQTISAQQSIVQAQAAIAAAQAQQAAIQSPVGAAIATFTTSNVAGIPVPVILAAGGLAIWYILKRK